MIPRYTRPEMARIWSDENRFRTWLAGEVAATETLAEAGLDVAITARTVHEGDGVDDSDSGGRSMPGSLDTTAALIEERGGRALAVPMDLADRASSVRRDGAPPGCAFVRLERPGENDTAYDLLGAYVGSEGCFGVTLDVTVRLTPNPEGIRTMLADFTSVDDAARATSAIVAAGILPAALELMDHGTIEAVESSIYAAGYPRDAAAVLLIEVDGALAGLDEDVSAVQRICHECGAREIRTASDAGERARLWQGRKKAFGAMGRVAPHLAVQDAVVPRTKLAPILARIAEIGARQRIHVCNVFHAGDGNLHPNVPYNGDDPDEAARVHAAMREIMELCIAEGGTITGEHGVGLDKIAYMERLFPGESLDAMCRLRDAFDPERRANPGKVVPSHRCREWLAAPGAHT